MIYPITSRAEIGRIVREELAKQLPILLRTLMSPDGMGLANLKLTKESSVYKLPVSVRVSHAFDQLHISTIGDLLNTPSERLGHVRNFGEVCFLELKTILHLHGFETTWSNRLK